MITVFVLLVVLFGVHILLRAMTRASQQSQLEDQRRATLREYARRKRLDELYGREDD